MNPGREQAWRNLQRIWFIVGAFVATVALVIAVAPEPLRLLLRRPVLAILTFLFEDAEPLSEQAVGFAFLAMGVAVLGSTLFLRLRLPQLLMRAEITSRDEILERLYRIYPVFVGMAAVVGLLSPALYIVTVSRLWLIAMVVIGILTWLVARPSLPDLPVGPVAPAVPEERPPEPLPDRFPTGRMTIRLVPELLGYAIWAYALYQGFWFIGRWTSNGLVWAPAFAIIVAPFMTLASLKPPQPITLKVIGGVTVLLWGFGFLIWPALAGVRGAAKARISPLFVLLISFVAYLIGVGALLGLFALMQPKGLDMASLFAPIWAGGPAIWGGLRLAAELVERRRVHL